MLAAPPVVIVVSQLLAASLLGLLFPAARFPVASLLFSGCFNGIMPSHPAGSGSGPLSSGGRTASYADVAAFEAGLHARKGQSKPLRPREVSLISVSNPKRVLLNPDTVNKIFDKAEDLSSLAAIFSFLGFLAISG